MDQAPHSGLAWAQAIVEQLALNGVTTFFVAPGSRSTPLVLAASRCRNVDTVVHFDERGAAFAALGHSRSGRTAAVITTSGTAVANLFPAVVEAAMDAVGLVCLTADRPAEARGIGANQTIDQVNFFGSFACFSTDLPAPADGVDMDIARSAVDRAIAAIHSAGGGVAHLNCAFRKPLQPEFDHGKLEWETNPRGRPALADPSREEIEEADEAARAALERHAGMMANARRGIIVAGSQLTSADGAAAVRVAQHLGFPLIADITSQVARSTDAGAIACHDRLLRIPQVREAGPDYVLQIGGRFVSNVLGEWLALHAPGGVLHVAPGSKPYDPFGVVTERIRCSAQGLARILTSADPGDPGRRDPWTSSWERMSTVARELTGDFLSVESVSEPAAAAQVWSAVAHGWSLLVGNSMPVRDFDSFGWTGRGPERVVANRGASGIDGLIATAVGYASGSGSPVLAVIGDQSALHDLNSLALLARASQQVVLVVVNNGGGGIFSFLPVSTHTDVFESHFAAAHGFTFEHAAATFGVPYSRANTLPELTSAVQSSAHDGASRVIELASDRNRSRQVHMAFDARLAEEVGSAPWSN